MKEEIKGVQLDAWQLRKLQLEMLDLLIEFDRVCKKHNITYFLSGGTLLGAVRHKGFIPWDDDVDVDMLRSDYDRFCEVCEDELDSEQFFFQNQENDPFYYWPYGKLRLKNTAYIRIGQAHLKQKTGICMDIFPLDYMSGNSFAQRFCEYLCWMGRKVLWSRVGCRLAQSPNMSSWYALLARLPSRWVMKAFDQVARLYNKEQTEYLVFHSMDSRSERGYTLRRSWFADVVPLIFEGRSFSAPVGYQEILYFWYGDYMKYPSEEKRVLGAEASYIRFSDHTELRG